MHSKPGRGWERGSSGNRRYPGGERGPSPPKEHFRRRDIGVSPERSKRGKWESPSPSKKNHIMGSPSRISHRRGFDIPPRSSFGREAGSPKTRSSFFEGDEFHVNSSRQEGRREGPGLVFLCNSSTMRDCFHFRVLGLPIAQQDIVKRVVPGTKLFLFNVELKELYGVFEAASHGGVNLVPEAFQGSREAYTAQVITSILVISVLIFFCINSTRMQLSPFRVCHMNSSFLSVMSSYGYCITKKKLRAKIRVSSNILYN